MSGEYFVAGLILWAFVIIKTKKDFIVCSFSLGSMPTFYEFLF